MHNLLVIGDNCFDITIKGRLNFERDRNFIPEHFHTTPAGTGINFTMAFARLGGAVEYATPISVDSFGMELRQFLHKEGVPFADFKSNKKSAIIVTFVSDIGERTTFALIKNSAYTDVKFESFKMHFLDKNNQPSGVYISGGLLTERYVQEEAIKIAEFAEKNHIKVFFDPQVRIGKEIPHFVEIANKIANVSNIIFGNSDELKYINLPCNALIVEKRGESGALIMEDKKEIYHVSGVKVNPVDTTGAGDVFNAAFLFAYSNTNGGLSKALEFANLTAAFSVTKLGAYFPTISEIREFALLNNITIPF